jgi:hypothetical protein
MTKADRLPGWRFRRLNDAQKEAYNQLAWYNPGPAERARLKKVLGWRRTRTETICLAAELFERGLVERAVANELGVSVGYLRKLGAGQPTPENAPRNPSNQAEENALTCETKVVVPRGLEGA